MTNSYIQEPRKIFSLLFILTVSLSLSMALSAQAATTTASTSSATIAPTEVTLEVTKKFSGTQEGFTESDFSFRIFGDNGIDEVIPHGGTIDLEPGSYSMEEVIPAGFDAEDWRIAWYGDTCKDNDDNTASLVIDDDDPKDYAGAKIFCEADNQFRPKDDDEGDNGNGTTTETYLLEGYVWHDVDEDGVIDDEEEFLAGWEVVAESGTTTMTTETNSEGYYSFEVPTGTWMLNEIVMEGWEITFPTDNQHVVEVPEDLEEPENEEVSLWWPFNLIFELAHAQAHGPFFNFGNVLAAPTCNFTASDTSVDAGDTVTLSWSLSTATEVAIDNGIGTTTATGTTDVTVDNDVTYVLSALFANAPNLTCPVTIDVDNNTGGGGDDSGDDDDDNGNGDDNGDDDGGGDNDDGNNGGTGGGSQNGGGVGGPTPLILGEQVSVVPWGGANAGAGGAAAGTETVVWSARIMIGVLVLLGWLRLRRDSVVS